MKRFVLVLAVMVGSAFPAIAVSGELDNLMGSMFATTSTNPQPYGSNTRNGYYGGSISIRSPVKNYTLMSYDAPTYSAGCSGISLSAGSFSIMNSEEFKQMIRQIGSAAGMYFFKLAIETVAPTIMKTLNGLEDFMSKFTLNNVNTCRAGEGIAKAMMGNLEDVEKVADGMMEDYKTAKGVAKGAWDDTLAFFTKSKGEKTTGAGGAAEVPYGNLVWRALISRNVAATVGTAEFSVNPYQMSEWMMSMIGTVVINQGPGENPDGSAAGCTGQCTEKVTPYPLSPVIGVTVPMLIDGGVDGDSKKQYWSCGADVDEMGCTKPVLKPFDFEGTKAYVHNLLFGVTDISVKEPVAGSLIANLQAGEELTHEQTGFLMMMPASFLRNFIVVQKSLQAASSLVVAYEEYMAVAAARRIGEAMIGGIRLTETGKQGDKFRIPMFEEQRNNLKAREMEVVSARVKENELLKEADKVLNEAFSIAAREPKYFYTPFNKE